MAQEYLEKLSAFVADLPAEWPVGIQLESKHFFSGAALYAEGRICLTLTPVGLALKLPAETRERLLETGEALPLQYFPKAPIKKEYVLFPAGVEGDASGLGKYTRESIEYVLTKPNPKRK